MTEHKALKTLLAAVECARDYGLFEDDKYPGGLEGIPSGDFNNKWGDLKREEVVKRIATAITAAQSTEVS